jgi:hypothetical protein
MPTQVREINRLGALNLRQETTKLEEYECVKLVNFDVSRKPGTLALRRGKELLYNVSVGEIVRQVAKVNGKRYQVAGRLLYRDGTAIVRELADPEDPNPENSLTPLGNQKSLETNFQAFRPLDDTHIWAFIADDNIMFKDDGTRTYLWGIDLIPLPKPQLANQTGKVSTDTITAGTYGIAVTQIRWDIT